MTFLRGMLIAEQLAISLALLVGMGLVLRSRDLILKPDVGYDPNAIAGREHRSGESRVFALSVRSPFTTGCCRDSKVCLASRSVALSNLPPFQGQRLTAICDKCRTTETACRAHLRAVSSNYFDMTGIRLVRGRLFSTAESRFPANPMPSSSPSHSARALALGAHDVGRRLQFDGRYGGSDHWSRQRHVERPTG